MAYMEDGNNDTTHDKHQGVAIEPEGARDPGQGNESPSGILMSRNEEQQLHHVKLNSLEERQLDQLFGAG